MAVKTILVVLLAMCGCAQVPVNDSIFIGSLGVNGGALFHTLNTDSRVLTLPEFAQRWNDLSDPLVCTNSSTFAEWKSDIEKLCSFENVCTTNMQEAVDTFYAKIKAANAAAQKAIKATKK